MVQYTTWRTPMLIALYAPLLSCGEPLAASHVEDTTASTERFAVKKTASTAVQMLHTVAGDFDGDGYQDLVARHVSTDTWTVWMGSSTFPPTSTTRTPPKTTKGVAAPFLAGDFDGDGSTDILVGDVGGTNRYVLRGSSAGLSTTMSAWTTTPSTLRPRLVVDDDGDGYDDVWAHDETGERLLRFRGGSSGLATTADESVVFAKGYTTRILDNLYHGDFDDDGDRDLLVFGRFHSTSGSTTSGPAILMVEKGGSGWTETVLHTATQEDKGGGSMEYEFYSMFGVHTDGSLADAYYFYLEDGWSAPWGGGITTITYEYCTKGSCGSLPSGWPKHGWGLHADIDNDGDIELMSTTGIFETGTGTLHSGGFGRWSHSGDFDGDGAIEFVRLDTRSHHWLDVIITEDKDGDGVDSRTDCDDDDDTVYPGAPETWYDGVDSDCSGGSDFDQDGDLDDDDSHGGTDCNDLDPSIHGAAAETWYDGVDSDCSGGSDYDQDADGHDASAHGGSDCLDTDPAVNPDAVDEWYDGVDSDCSGGSDFDQDKDGEDVDRFGGTDCDDTDPSIGSGAMEIWYDGVDQDCSGGSDFDQDTDGQDSAHFGGTDCDDTDPTRALGNPEIWYDGVDQDCLGGSDFDQDGDGQDSDAFGGTDCDDTDPSIGVGQTERWYDGVDQDCSGTSDYDQDGDGHDDAGFGGGDCDDIDPARSPSATEVVGDEFDSDCDGAELCFADSDGDGWRVDATVRSVDEDCADSGEASLDVPAEDCDDSDPTINPDQIDTPGDRIDQDCDGVDERRTCSTVTAGGPALVWLMLMGAAMARRRRRDLNSQR